MGMGFWRYERQQRKKPGPHLQITRKVYRNHEYRYQWINVFKFNEYHGHGQLTIKSRCYLTIFVFKKNYQKDFFEKIIFSQLIFSRFVHHLLSG